MKFQDDIKIEASRGFGKANKERYYVRPIWECFNRSRSVSGYSRKEIEEKIEKLIKKWYAPEIILYEINGLLIGSNNESNALKEYWRVCEQKDIGKTVQAFRQGKSNKDHYSYYTRKGINGGDLAEIIPDKV